MNRFFLNDTIILILIILNSFVLFISGFDLDNNILNILYNIDNIITLLFIIEIVIKIQKYKKHFFNSNWNIVDLIFVVISIPFFLCYILNIEVIDFSFILIFRVLRIFKTFRFFKFIPNIEHLIRGVERALKASIFVIIGFILYIFTIGLLSFYLFKDVSPQYFNNPLISLYSIFKIFTVEGWFEIPESVINNLTETKSFFVYIYFIFVVLSGGILGLSIVNSIFVDAMVSDNNDSIEKKIDNLEKKIDILISSKEKK